MKREKASLKKHQVFPSRRGSYSDFLGGIFLTVLTAAAVFLTSSALIAAASNISDAAQTQQAERTERDFAAGVLWRGGSE
jgi:hypothetical protein